MIALENVTKSFYKTKAVEDLSLKISQGEVVGFLGPNGAGKTTTMRMITNIYAPDSGRILIDKVDTQEGDVVLKKKIGYLPENNPIYSDMLVSEYLGFIADIHEMPLDKRKERFDRTIHETGIASVFYKPLGELSKGYKQRVGLAQAILHAPQILILDEPTEGLDPNQRVEMRQLVKNLGEERTVILCTHVLQEVSTTCSRVVILNKGKLIADGTIDELTASAKGLKQITVEIKGEGFKEKLSKIGDIKSTERASKDRTKITLAVPHNVEARPEIFEMAKINGWTLYELHQEEASLEDVFRDLTLN